MTDRVRTAFFGTPAAAVAALEALAVADDIDLVAVVTNPDRPKGRSSRPVAPPVKEAALRHGLAVHQPGKPREIVDDLRALDLDVGAIVAYGAILPREVLDVARHGFVNLHFSLLPRWRGAAPVQHALRAGDEITGVTTFVLDEGMDTGPVLDRVEVPVGPFEHAGSLTGRLASIGAEVLVDSVRALVGGARPTPQDDDGATLAPKVTSGDVAIDWRAGAAEVANLVRSANPAPGAHTAFRGGRLKVWLAEVADDADTAGEPGTVLALDARGVVVATGDGAVRLREVQPDGKARMDGGAFANGYQPAVGAPLAAT